MLLGMMDRSCWGFLSLIWVDLSGRADTVLYLYWDTYATDPLLTLSPSFLSIHYPPVYYPAWSLAGPSPSIQQAEHLNPRCDLDRGACSVARRCARATPIHVQGSVAQRLLRPARARSRRIADAGVDADGCATSKGARAGIERMRDNGLWMCGHKNREGT